jgi:hypothetical protein
MLMDGYPIKMMKVTLAWTTDTNNNRSDNIIFMSTNIFKGLYDPDVEDDDNIHLTTDNY